MILKLNNIFSTGKKLFKPRNKIYCEQKIIKKSIAHYNKSVLQDYPTNTIYFSIIKTRKRNTPDDYQEITSFYNEQKQLLKRYIIKSKEKPLIKEYKYDTSLLNCENETTRLVHTRKVTTSDLKNKLKEEEFFVINYFDKYNKTENKYGQKLTTIIKEYLTQQYKKCIRTTITEYPMTQKLEPQNTKKILGITIELPHFPFFKNAKIIDTTQTTNTKFPNNDEFIISRFLTGEDKCKQLTEYYLQKTNNDNVGMLVFVDKKKVSDDAIAVCKFDYREIDWGEVPKYTQVSNVARHEVEHVSQHVMSEEFLKRTSSPNIKYNDNFNYIEGEKITNAIQNYPAKTNPYYKKLYEENYLEIKANQAAQIAEKEYRNEQKFFFEEFPHLPDRGDIF